MTKRQEISPVHKARKKSKRTCSENSDGVSPFTHIERWIGAGGGSMTTDQGNIPVETGYEIWYRRIASGAYFR